MTHISDDFFLNFDSKAIFILADVRDIFQKVLVFTLTPQNLEIFVQGTADRSYSRLKFFLKFCRSPQAHLLTSMFFHIFHILVPSSEP